MAATTSNVFAMPNICWPVGRPRSQYRNQCQDGHDHQALKNVDRHDGSTVRGRAFTAFLQDGQWNGAGAHGEGEPDHQRRLPFQRGDADDDDEEGRDGGRRQYVLRRAKSEHEAAHGPKPRRLEIEPYGKQQQHDADFTDRLHLVDVTR
jgi:hypothetical protein